MTAMTREQSDAWIMARIPQLGPETAEYVIKQAETARLRWSPHVMKALLEQAGKRTPETEAVDPDVLVGSKMASFKALESTMGPTEEAPY